MQAQLHMAPLPMPAGCHVNFLGPRRESFAVPCPVSSFFCAAAARCAGGWATPRAGAGWRRGATRSPTLPTSALCWCWPPPWVGPPWPRLSCAATDFPLVGAALRARTICSHRAGAGSLGCSLAAPTMPGGAAAPMPLPPGLDLGSQFPHLAAWAERVTSREAVKRGMQVGHGRSPSTFRSPRPCASSTRAPGF